MAKVDTLSDDVILSRFNLVYYTAVVFSQLKAHPVTYGDRIGGFDALHAELALYCARILYAVVSEHFTKFTSRFDDPSFQRGDLGKGSVWR